MSSEPQTTAVDDRIAELIGPIDEAAKGVYQRMREMICPCLGGKDCLWPRCGKVGNGIGHYP